MLLPPESAPAASSRSRGEALVLATAALAQLGDDEQTLRAAASALAFTAERRQQLALAFVPRPALTELVAVLQRSGATEQAARVERARERAFIAGELSGIRLTPRELEVARHLSTGAALPDIAAALSVSPNTVKSQVRSLYRKLGVTSRAEAVSRLTVLGITSASEWAGR
nr:LuxR C-terminal-related transcriptional regulator [Herbiconiux sp. VKM Ac-1786]